MCADLRNVGQFRSLCALVPRGTQWSSVGGGGTKLVVSSSSLLVAVGGAVAEVEGPLVFSVLEEGSGVLVLSGCGSVGAVLDLFLAE